jgi:hypothetical protein
MPVRWPTYSEYSLHKRFSAFGEVGFGYTSAGTSSTATAQVVFDNPTVGQTTHGWGIRTGAGVIFYF